MTVVGYDPALLGRFAAELAMAADHLDHVARHPGLAHDATRRSTLTGVAERLRWWAARARGIATCEVMERVHHLELPVVAAHEAPLREALARQWQGEGLALAVLDEGTEASRAEALDAAAQVARLRHGRPVTDDDLEWLARVSIGPGAVPDPTAVATLLVHLGSGRHAGSGTHPADPRAQRARDALVASLHGSPDALGSLLEGLEPALAAEVLATSGLTGAALGEAAADVIDRWEQERWWVVGRHTPWNTLDHVLACVTADASALAALWERRRTRPGILLYGPNDERHVNELVTALVDPTLVDAPTASRRLLPLLDYARSIPHAHATDLDALRTHLVLAPGYGHADEVRWWQLRQALATAAAPWMVWLTSGDAMWGGSSGVGAQTLTWLVDAPGASGAFTRGLGDALQRRAGDLGDEPAVRFEAIERMAWTIGAVDALVEQADRPADAGIDMLRGLVALSIGHAAGAAAAAATAVVAPPLAGVARTVSSGRVTEVLDDDDDAGRHERVRLASLDRRTTAAAALIAVLATDHRRRGWLSPDVPPPPSPLAQRPTDPGAPDPLAAWLAHLDGLEESHVAPIARRELHQAWQAVTPADQRAAVDRGRAQVTG